MSPIAVAVHLHVGILLLAARARERLHAEQGQSTAEYALVLLAVAGIAVLFMGWAQSSGRVARLLDAVFDSVTSRVR